MNSRLMVVAVIVLACCLMLACQREATVAPMVPVTPATTPADADPLADFVALLQREPRHVGGHYIAARLAARSGDSIRALEFLTRLALLDLGDELEPDDFPGIRDGAPYQDLAKRFAAAAPAVGEAVLWTETACADFLPEGTAWDAKRGELLLSSGRLRSVIAVKPDGSCREVVPRADAGLLSVLGMAVDAANDELWVASTAAPFMLDADTTAADASLLARIDLASGRVEATYALPGGGMLNDLALATNGDVYATDSINGSVLRLRHDETTLQPIVNDHSFEGPNGIAMLASGDLFVADFHGLWLLSVDASNKTTRARLTAPDEQYLGGFDGIASDGDAIIGIQNLVGRGRVWRLEIDATQASVKRAQLLLRGHADFLNPTTGVLVDNQFLFVADPKLQRMLDTGMSPLPVGRSGHRVLSVQKR